LVCVKTSNACVDPSVALCAHMSTRVHVQGCDAPLCSSALYCLYRKITFYIEKLPRKLIFTGTARARVYASLVCACLCDDVKIFVVEIRKFSLSVCLSA
jgi:hypothetical protein